MENGTYDHHWLAGRKSPIKKIVIVQQRKFRGILDPTFISLALAACIISNQSPMSIMSKHLINTLQISEGLKSNEGSLIRLASASPAPDPSPASGRSAASGSHKVPPMNGSIFGKRSTDSVKAGSSQRSSGNDGIQIHEDVSKSNFHSTEQSRLNNDNYQSDQIPKTNQASRSAATNYKDIITGIIEEFLALNNESDPEEASVAFCRMIVYECSQMLSSRRQVMPRWRRKKLHRSQIGD